MSARPALCLVLFALPALAAGPPTLRGIDLYGDPLPPRAALRFGTVRTGFARAAISPRGHRAAVRVLCFSPDGRLLASGGDDGVAIVWEVASGRAIATFPDHVPAVSALAFSPDGKTLTTGEAATTADILLWDVRRKIKRTLYDAHNRGVTSLCYSPDGRTLLSVGGDGRARWWTTGAPRKSGEVPGNFHGARLAGFLGPKHVLVHHPTGECRIVTVPDGKVVDTIGHPSAEENSPSHAAVLTAGVQRLVVQQGGRALTFDPVTRLRLLDRAILFSTHWRPPAPVSISPCGDLLVAGIGSKEWTGFQVHDLTIGREIAHLGRGASEFTAFAFSPDGRWLASATHDTSIVLWDVAAVRAKAVLEEWGQPLLTLTAKLRSISEAERRLTELLPGLDSEDFDERQKASAALKKLDGPIAAAMTRVMRESLSLEVRMRLRRALDRLDLREQGRWADPEQLRALLHVLAQTGTPEARGVLAELARQKTSLGREAAALLRPVR